MNGQPVRVMLCNVCGVKLEQRLRGFTRKPYCPDCKEYREEDQYRNAWEVTCPNCRSLVHLPVGREDTCPRCGTILKVDGTGVSVLGEIAKRISAGDIPAAQREGALIFCTAVVGCNARTEVVPEAGTRALIVRGEDVRAVTPGDLRPFSTGLSERETTYAAVYFVRNSIVHEFLCGYPHPFTVSDRRRLLDGDVKLSAKLTLKVTDPAKLMMWAGYRACKEEELVDGADGRPSLDQEVLHCFTDECQPAVIRLVESGAVALDELYARRDLVRDELVRAISGRLEAKGLAVEHCVIEGLDVTARGKKDPLLDRIEQTVHWRTSPVRVHEKGNELFFADVVIGGTAAIRLKDREKLLSTGQGLRWNDVSRPAGSVASELGEETGRTLNAIFQELLQRMVDDVDAPVTDLSRFLPFLQQTVSGVLNESSDLLSGCGLRAENVTVEVQSVDPCLALQRRGKRAGEKAEMEIEEDMRRFNDRIRITRAKEGGAMEIELDDIKLETEQKLDRNNEVRKDLATGGRIRDYERTTEENRARAASELDAKKLKEEEEDRGRQRQSEQKLRSLDEEYEEWQRRRRLQRAQMEEQARDERDARAAGLDLQRMDAEAKRREKLDEAELERGLDEVRRKIQESGLDWRRQLDAYEHLQKMTEVNDEFDLEERKQRSAVSIRQLQEELELSLSDKTMEQMEKAERYAEERRDRAARAEFERDMERRRFETADQIERLRIDMERERDRQKWESDRKRDELEIERLRLELDQALKRAEIDQRIHSSDKAAEVQKTQAVADVEKARAQYDYTYQRQAGETVGSYMKERYEKAEDELARRRELEEKASGELKALDERHRAEDREMAEKNLDRIERLYHAVLSFEKQDEERHGRGLDRISSDLRAEMQELFGREQKQIEDLFSYVKKLHEDTEELRRSVQAIGQQANGYPPHGGAYDRPAGRYCKYCGTPLRTGETFCPNCRRMN